MTGALAEQPRLDADGLAQQDLRLPPHDQAEPADVPGCTGQADRAERGVWSRELCRALGVRTDLFRGKGYSFSVDADPVPRQVVHLGDARVVCTPMGKGVRVAGSMEFDADPDAFHPRRVAAIVAAASGYLRSADWAGRQDEWVGARVLTPDGLPAVGRLPGHERVLLASGHNMLGLMLGPATGRLVTDFVTAVPDPELATVLDPARLSRPA